MLYGSRENIDDSLNGSTECEASLRKWIEFYTF